ncbi:Glycosyltransferase involved in cell wall bisynthesis [Limimonas halophila]|uniref:Glycosyltransferase involved in cell wall bisynthesis n=1 Tax=Limimonas halophila TaxID=1082479 RepID=A0A1G7L5F3_9PROT|nr:glycosyltransferase [Limimonas halophila]SDF44586.1 Glycosyltransferase involved in cell wall bisynthesis [Limimonas halophila]
MTEPAPMRDVTAGVKAFLRQAELRDTLTALTGHGLHEVIVADDSGIGPEREALYAELREVLPLRVIELPYDSGASAGRNAVARACITPYLLMLDDDLIVPDNLAAMRRAVDASRELGGVSCIWREHGRLSSCAANLYRVGRRLYKDIGRGPACVPRPDGKRLPVYDIVEQSVLFRTETFDDVLWDEHFTIMREHVDFFLQHKALGRWRFAVVPEVVMRHEKTPKTAGSDYAALRYGRERKRAADDHFRAKWDLHGVVEGRWQHAHERPVKRALNHAALLAHLRLGRTQPIGMPAGSLDGAQVDAVGG